MSTHKREISITLDDGSPFVMWEREKKSEFKQGMIIDTQVCSSPECRYLHIHAIAIDERFKNMRFEGEKFIYSVETERRKEAVPLPNQHLTAVFHMDSSDVSIPAGTPPEKQDPELFSRLSSHVRRDLIEALKRRWRMLKKINRDQWRKMDWSWWEEGLMVGWNEVFPDDPDILFDSAGKKYWIRDLYCINPQCPCKDAMLAFSEIGGEKKCKELGGIALDLKAFRINEVQAIEISSGELMGLWKVFQKDSMLKTNLKLRQKEMKLIGKEIAAMNSKKKPATLEASLKIGRNDPCPCGSGKKYKKCCLS